MKGIGRPPPAGPGAAGREGSASGERREPGIPAAPGRPRRGPDPGVGDASARRRSRAGRSVSWAVPDRRGRRPAPRAVQGTARTGPRRPRRDRGRRDGRRRARRRHPVAAARQGGGAVRPGRRDPGDLPGAGSGQPVRAALRLPQRRRHPAPRDDRAGVGAGRRLRRLAVLPGPAAAGRAADRPCAGPGGGRRPSVPDQGAAGARSGHRPPARQRRARPGPGRGAHRRPAHHRRTFRGAGPRLRRRAAAGLHPGPDDRLGPVRGVRGDQRDRPAGGRRRPGPGGGRPGCR